MTPTRRSSVLGALATLLVGIVVIAGQIAAGAVWLAIAPSGDWLVLGIGAGFLIGVALGYGLTRGLPLIAFPAMGLFALNSVTPMFVVDVPPWGRVTALSDAGPASGAAGYTPDGWRIQAGYATEERLSGGRGSKSYGSRRLAPLVGSGWTSADPVAVWVAGETRDSGRILPSHPKFWGEPGGEFARMVGVDLSGAQLAAGRAARRHGLKTREEPVIVMRVPPVAEAQRDQVWALAWAAHYPVGAWSLCVAIAVLLARRSARWR